MRILLSFSSGKGFQFTYPGFASHSLHYGNGGISATGILSAFHSFLSSPQGDIFSGLNDGILSRAEALAAVDMQKHQQSHAHSQMQQQLKHDVMYHSMGGPPQRPLQI
uniref:Uncharacterized protein n=1 Tax=Megaselia scalaris TaxID=36166 RepID=T1GIC1_MEGSC